MKVSVNLTVEVDVEAWMETYGPNPRYGENTDAQVVRRDVRDHVLDLVHTSAPLGTGEVPGEVWLRDA